jgi:hypothetical protein
VHPAAGSHANFFGEALYLGRSAEQGVGCDDTRGPTFDVRPVVQTIPSDQRQARKQFPWALIAPAIELEQLSATGALRRSGRLVRGRWLKVASLIVVGGVLVIIAGPLIGVLLIVTTDTPFWLVNVIAGVVYAVAMPFVALTTAYVYVDARGRGELEPKGDAELPAEFQLAGEPT